MIKIIYMGIISLDGYIADENENFDWAIPDQEVHIYINNLMHSIGTYLYGRRMYEVMNYWETADTFPNQPPYILEFATIWQSAEKIVYSKTLAKISSKKTRIEKVLDPMAILQMKSNNDRDILVGGPDLAIQLIKANIVDEFHLFLTPIIVGGGKKFFPDNIVLKLELLKEYKFNNGMVHLYYHNIG